MKNHVQSPESEQAKKNKHNITIKIIQKKQQKNCIKTWKLNRFKTNGIKKNYTLIRTKTENKNTIQYKKESPTWTTN